jgi:hypothetical protein
MDGRTQTIRWQQGAWKDGWALMGMVAITMTMTMTVTVKEGKEGLGKMELRFSFRR